MASEISSLERKTGTAVPVSALRTKSSLMCGEFLDLIPFADFCKKSGLSIIQILPVNDTGTESSPYSALSAFALHPMYISLTALPEFDPLSDGGKKTEVLRKKHESDARFSYALVRKEKISLLRSIFSSKKESIISSSELASWIAGNEWIKVYAVFSYYKMQNNEASWKQWKTFTNPSLEQITKVWETPVLQEDLLFYAWVQMRLDEQFAKASTYCKSLGIALKGDIPIMMNEDSSDAWAYPQFFIQSLRAGSPPDGPNPVGQNWGFPIYNWESLAKDDYSWWKKRLQVSSRYYTMFRIDHVLGFFRIWAAGEYECTASCGFPLPNKNITKKELNDAGFSGDQIRWLSLPHVPTRSIEDVNNNDYLGTHGLLSTIMDRLGNEELWVFKTSIRGDRDIWESSLPHPVKEKLAQHWRDRCLICLGKDFYSPSWIYQDSTAWKSLDRTMQEKLGRIFDDKKYEMEHLWEKQARTLLSALKDVGGMTPCAEDLGALPDSVPHVLEDLGIYGLRVIRWHRAWHDYGQPFIPFSSYPELSVASTSVHDSSTLRLWWLTENDARDFYAASPPPNNVVLGQYNPDTARYLLGQAARAASALCIHPVQDFLALCAEYYAPDPQSERVNIPGSVTEFNWTYRLPCLIEELAANVPLHKAINEIADMHTRKE